MKLLIVEDNRLLAASLRQVLKDTFIVDTAHTAAKALELSNATNYGIMLLDLRLPDADGRVVCRELRARGKKLPILIATGEKQPERCIELLDAGADDYITKPYNMDVLQARLRALLRRQKSLHDETQLSVGGLSLYPESRTVIRDGQQIKLRKKEFDILEYLIRNSGRAVTRTMIMNHAWEAGKEGWNNTVDVHIKYLRDKVDKPFDTPLIKTAYGVGYMVDNTG